MAGLFFPTANETAGMLLTFVTFGIPFLVRPLGALALGAYGDRHGRKAALTLTITLMMIGTSAIALAPTYAAVGIWAPFIIVFARMIQGFSVGGEFGSATAFMAEQDPHRRSFFASWQFASQGLTTLLATGFGAGLAALLTAEQIKAYGWRIPFLFGVIIGPVAYYMRRCLQETPEFLSQLPPSAPVAKLFGDQKQRLLICIGMLVVGTATMYTILFLPTFAIRQLGLPPYGAFLGGFLTGTVQVLLIPIVGALSDRLGGSWIATAAAAAVLVLIAPLFAWMAVSPTMVTLLAVQGLLGLFSATYLGAIGGILAKLFPTATRTTGLSIGNALAVTIFGGFAPLISAWLIATTGSKLAPSFYVMVTAAISLSALIAARRAESTLARMP
jgi:MHS family proline/betaine transporter-like MFS transporter